MTTKRSKAVTAKGAAKDSRDMTPDELAAVAVMRPGINAGVVAARFNPLGAPAPEEFAQCVEAETTRADSTGASERMLLAQAHALDAMFAGLSVRAAANVGTYMDAAETYLKLALRAQNQCRMTLESLAAIKNPPVIFAKQANIAGGHQQINNGDAVPVARGDETAKPQPELSRLTHDTESLDYGTSAAAIGSHPTLATLEAQHRAKD